MSAVGVKVINLSDNPLPQYSTYGSAAFDFASNEDVTLEGGATLPIKTGLYMEIPSAWQMSIRSRSGMSTMGVVVANAPATIDSDYRGELKVILHNRGENPVVIHKGDRIAQGLIEPVYKVIWDEATNLSTTLRGTGGLGSTGR